MLRPVLVRSLADERFLADDEGMGSLMFTYARVCFAGLLLGSCSGTRQTAPAEPTLDNEATTSAETPVENEPSAVQRPIDRCTFRSPKPKAPRNSQAHVCPKYAWHVTMCESLMADEPPSKECAYQARLNVRSAELERECMAQQIPQNKLDVYYACVDPEKLPGRENYRIRNCEEQNECLRLNGWL